MKFISLILFLFILSCTQINSKILKADNNSKNRFSELKQNPFVFYGPYNGKIELKTDLAAYAFDSYFRNISKFKNLIAISLQKETNKNYVEGKMTFGVNNPSDNIIMGENIESEDAFFQSEEKPYTVMISDFKLYEGTGELFGIFPQSILILDVDFLIYNNKKSELIQKFKLSSEVNSVDLEGMKLLPEEIAISFYKIIDNNGVLEKEKKKKKKKKN